MKLKIALLVICIVFAMVGIWLVGAFIVSASHPTLFLFACGPVGGLLAVLGITFAADIFGDVAAEWNV